MSHTWRTIKCLAWPVCSHCGLVRLKNDATRAATRQGCKGRATEQQEREARAWLSKISKGRWK